MSERTEGRTPSGSRYASNVARSEARYSARSATWCSPRRSAPRVVPLVRKTRSVSAVPSRSGSSLNAAVGTAGISVQWAMAPGVRFRA